MAAISGSRQKMKYAYKFLPPQKKSPVTFFGHREVWRVSGVVPVGGETISEAVPYKECDWIN